MKYYIRLACHLTLKCKNIIYLKFHNKNFTNVQNFSLQSFKHHNINFYLMLFGNQKYRKNNFHKKFL